MVDLKIRAEYSHAQGNGISDNLDTEAAPFFVPGVNIHSVNTLSHFE